MPASFESNTAHAGVDIDPTVAGHIAGDVLDAVAKHDPEALGEAVDALNQDLKQHGLLVVSREDLDNRTYTPEDILRAERIAHLIDMKDVFLNANLTPAKQYVAASAIISAEDMLPPRRRGDKYFVKPYDGTKDSYDEIRQQDREYYKHLQSILRQKQKRR